MLEAVAAKCFVITTQTGGAKEIISNGESGIIIADNEIDKLKNALNAAVGNDEFRRQAANNAYETLKNRFTWKNTADKLESIM